MKLTSNRLRHELIPHLEAQYQPQLRNHLNRLADLIKDEQAWLDQILTAEFTANAQFRTNPYPAITFEPTWFAAQPLALQRQLVRRSAAQLKDLHNFEAAHVEAVLALFGSSEAGQINLPDGLIAFRQGGLVGLGLPYFEERDAVQFPLDFPLPGELVSPDGRWKLESTFLEKVDLEILKKASKYEAYLDAAKVGTNLQLRAREAGERFRPLGAPGRRKVQDVMLEAGISRELRDSWPLLVLSTQPEQIVWIPGAALAEDFKVESGSAYYLRFTLLES